MGHSLPIEIRNRSNFQTLRPPLSAGNKLFLATQELFLDVEHNLGVQAGHRQVQLTEELLLKSDSTEEESGVPCATMTTSNLFLQAMGSKKSLYLLARKVF